MCMYKREKKSGYLQPAVSSDWRKPAVNGYCQQKKKKKLCLSVDLLNDFMMQSPKITAKLTG